MGWRWLWVVGLLGCDLACEKGPGTDNVNLGEASQCPSDHFSGPSGECLAPCQHSDDCDEGFVCVTQSQICVPDPDAPVVSVPVPGEDKPPGEKEDDPPPCAQPPCTDEPVCPESAQCCEDDDCGFGQGCGGEFTCGINLGAVIGDVIHTCQENGDCGLAMACVKNERIADQGLCAGCLDDLQCSLLSYGSRCLYGVCIHGGLGPVDCLLQKCQEGSRCNFVNGQCEPVCDADQDCGEGRLCVPLLKRCVDDFRCENHGQCGEGLQCLGAEVLPLVPLDWSVCRGCTEQTPCPDGLICVQSTCVPDVLGSELCKQKECPEGTLCDPLDGTCYPQTGLCEEDSDCRPGLTCSGLDGFVEVCTGCEQDSQCRPGQQCRLGACSPL